MRDPMTWSVPLGNVFGITIRIHILFPVVALGIILKASFQPEAHADAWIISSGVMGLLFISVLLHEFGHCFAARAVDGDAHEIMLWPLGGLASCDVPHMPRAHLITAAGGPLVNLLLCLVSGGVLAYFGLVRPPINPTWSAFSSELAFYALNGDAMSPNKAWVEWLARFFFVNWMLLWFNVLLVGFPMDGGRILQAALWPRMGFAASMRAAIFAGFVVSLCVGIFAIAAENVLTGFLALFIYSTCRLQLLLLDHGGDEALFGYDFSQGYTSLEKETPRRQPSFWQNWQQSRAAKKLQRELEEREKEERRMDELLEKVQRDGLHALTDEERRFLTRVSARYRNRN